MRDGFLPPEDAAALRGVFDQRFADPRAIRPERFLWDYWHVPDQYTLVRTQVRLASAAAWVHVCCDWQKIAVYSFGSKGGRSLTEDGQCSWHAGPHGVLFMRQFCRAPPVAVCMVLRL